MVNGHLKGISHVYQDDRVRDTARMAMKRNVLTDIADYQGIDAGST